MYSNRLKKSSEFIQKNELMRACVCLCDWKLSNENNEMNGVKLFRVCKGHWLYVSKFLTNRLISLTLNKNGICSLFLMFFFFLKCILPINTRMHAPYMCLILRECMLEFFGRFILMHWYHNTLLSWKVWPCNRNERWTWPMLIDENSKLKIMCQRVNLQTVCDQVDENLKNEMHGEMGWEDTTYVNFKIPSNNCLCRCYFIPTHRSFENIWCAFYRLYTHTHTTHKQI